MTPTQATLIVNAPEPVTVQAPDTTELIKTYTDVIMPMEAYTISNADEYIQAKKHWETAKTFSVSIETLFKDACKKAYDAHKALTSLREQLKGPADKIGKKIGAEIMRYEDAKEAERRAEEARHQAEEDAKWRAEQAAAEAERQRLIAERQKAVEALDPWDVPEEAEAPIPAPVVLPPPPPVRLESLVPTVIGGSRTVDKPWEARFTDEVATLKWVLEKPEERIRLAIDWRMAFFNGKAREFGKDLSRVIPGVEGFKDKTLKRS